MADETPQFPGEGRRLEDGVFEAPGIVRTSAGVPEIQPLPELSELVNLSNADLNLLLQQYGISDQWPALIAQMQRYNADFATLSTRMDPEAFAAAEARLLDLTPREDGRPSRAMLGLARRTQERYTTLEAIDGDVMSEMIRIAEEDESTCGGCFELSGKIATYAEHMTHPPGSQECGGNCRCQLIRVE